MDVLVPEGVGDKAGYIRIESEGADVEVKGIVMFYKQGVFLQEFTDEELKLGSPSGVLWRIINQHCIAQITVRQMILIR